MKKFQKIVFMVSFVAVCGLFFNFNAPQANAFTADEIRAQIALLMAQISELQNQLNQTGAWCHTFTFNLRYGDGYNDAGVTGREVQALQTALGKEGFGSLSSEQASGEFGQFTASAVVGFQQKYKQDILAPWGLEYGTGYVGKTTREKLNELYGCGTTPIIACENLWWYDNNTQYCQQKQFCGTYMYLGLRTFATEQECETSLQPTPSITVTSPNGGEQWVIGETYNIAWESSGSTDTVRITLIDGTASTASLSQAWYKDNVPNTGIYNFVVPNIPSKNQYKIHISFMSSTDISDDSDNYFSIVAAQETTCHTSALWAWNYCSSSCKCDAGEGDCDTDADCAEGLYCAKNVGANYGQDVKMDVCEVKQTITCVDTDGGKNYNTKGIAKENGKIYTDYCISSSWLKEYFCLSSGVANEDHPCRCGEGRCISVEEVRPIVVFPNGGQTLEKGTIYEILWEHTPILAGKNVEISINLLGPGAPYLTGSSAQQGKDILLFGPNNTNINSIISSHGTFSWLIPNTLVDGEYKIAIEEYDPSTGQNYIDLSDASFNIISPAEFITVLSPNSGEQWVVGSTQTIRWISNTESSRVVIDLLDGQGQCVDTGLPAVVANNEAIEWVVPSTFSTGRYKMRVMICPVSFSSQECANVDLKQYGYDESDNYFSIVAAQETTCHTSALWAWNYCSSSCKCDAGEGDCDTDADCAEGLYCAKNVGANYGQDAKMDVCEVKTSITCVAGMTLCNGNCVDIMTNSNNCGTCGNQCVTGDTCVNGVCTSGSSILLKDLMGASCSATSDCVSGFCVDGVCCNNACAGRDCQTCGALSSQGIGYCGFVNSSSADPRNDCTQGSTVADGCKSDNCSGKNWSCGVVQNHNDGGCPACQTCDGINAVCKAYSNNTQDVNGQEICKSCKYCMSGSCVNIANGQDMFSECSETGCGTGNCDGNGKCGWFTSGEHGCAKCKTCDGATSLSCKYIAKGQKDAQGSKVCNQPHYRCDGRANCTNPSSLTQTECFNLGSSDCAGLCPHWCNGESMCKECWTSSMKVYSSDYCSGTGQGVYSGSCNQLGGSCKCFYERYQYE